MWEKLEKNALFWLALGGGILTLGLAKEYFPKELGEIPHLFGILILIGSALVFYGVVIGFISKTHNFEKPVKGLLNKFLKDIDYDRWGYIEYAQESDLPLVHDCFEREFGKDIRLSS